MPYSYFSTTFDLGSGEGWHVLIYLGYKESLSYRGAAISLTVHIRAEKRGPHFAPIFPQFSLLARLFAVVLLTETPYRNAKPTKDPDQNRLLLNILRR